MKNCYFCHQKITEINHEDTDILKRFISGQFKILPARTTGACARHQRKLAKAIKKARILGFLPFTRK